MPKQYLAIKEKLMKEGKSEKVAEKSAAKIYNAIIDSLNSLGKGHVGKGSK